MLWLSTSSNGAFYATPRHATREKFGNAFFTLKTHQMFSVYITQMNIRKIIYLNCGERYEFMIDHHSYTHYLSCCEIKAWTEFEPMTSSIPVQCFTTWAIKPSGSLSHCEIVIYPLKVKNAKEYMKDHIFGLWRKIRFYDWSSQLHTLLK